MAGVGRRGVGLVEVGALCGRKQDESGTVRHAEVPLDYATPPGTELVPTSPLWLIVRLLIATPFALWGIGTFVVVGLDIVSEGRLHLVAVAALFWGAVPTGIAVAALRLPVRRRRVHPSQDPPLQRTGDEGIL
jgi:hypothetical protein